MTTILGRQGTRSLPVRMTDVELGRKGQELADAEIRLARLEEKKRESAADFRHAVAKVKEEIAELASVVESGEERREVEVYEQADEISEMVILRREDTGEEVERRPMTMEDRQATIA